ncbi:MAG: helix-turn-helix transcriptional regulator [Actinomycetota bacterium]|nr:helix-turn-helix transcriptional regulator [Actinomycetota bacterium]
MDNRQEVREFLISRRAKVTPQQAGLAAGSNRRVTGLRRSEVAALADVSVEYYSKIERGALARPRRSAKRWTPQPSLQRALDAVTEGPAFVRSGRMDILATNRLARAFYHDVLADPHNQANLARFNFLSPDARRFYPDWDLASDISVAILRTEAGRNPHDKDLHDLVGELSTRSDAFRARWGAHNVRHHGTGTKRFHHHAVGDLTLAYEGLDMAAEPGLTLTIYTAEPGSPSHEGPRLLATWAATQDTTSEAASGNSRSPSHR